MGSKRRQVLNLGKCQLPCTNIMEFFLHTLQFGPSEGRHGESWVSSFSGKAVQCFWEYKKDILEVVVGLGWGGNTVRAGSKALGMSQSSGAWVVKIKNRTKKKLGQIYLGLFPHLWTNTSKGESSCEYPHHTES